MACLLSRRSALGLSCLLFLDWLRPLAASSMARLEDWRVNFDEIPANDPRTRRVQDVLTRVVQATGKFPVPPPVLLIARDPFNKPLAVALPDHSIVLSPGVLTVCSAGDSQFGDDRLAFVLGHELAHLLQGDFWLTKFFQDLPTIWPVKDQNYALLQDLRHRLHNIHKAPEKELQADERGLIYAALAGFNPHAILADSNPNPFFEAWVGERPTEQSLSGHPAPQARAAALITHLQLLARSLAVFDLGVHSYQAGNYLKAIRAFTHFVDRFPSREVYHNLATSHHQFALQAYRKWHTDGQGFPYHLSLTLDPVTRVSQDLLGSRRDGEPEPDSEVLFHKHIAEAVRFYREALKIDPDYILTYTNLGAAFLLQEKFHSAVAVLEEEALKRVRDASKSAPPPSSILAPLLNNLGVAYFYVGKLPDARAHLSDAIHLDPTYDAPRYNLDLVERGVTKGALPFAPRVAGPPKPSGERIMGMPPRKRAKDVPPSWGTPEVTELEWQEEPSALWRYPKHGIRLYLARDKTQDSRDSKDNTIWLIVAEKNYKETSAQKIHIDSTKQDVRAKYGEPTRRLEMSGGGESWGYDDRGIAFQFRNSTTVISWLLF